MRSADGASIASPGPLDRKVSPEVLTLTRLRATMCSAKRLAYTETVDFDASIFSQRCVKSTALTVQSGAGSPRASHECQDVRNLAALTQGRIAKECPHPFSSLLRQPDIRSESCHRARRQ